jgi:hypothetical protein
MIYKGPGFLAPRPHPSLFSLSQSSCVFSVKLIDGIGGLGWGGRGAKSYDGEKAW